MTVINTNNKCRRIREWLNETISRRVDPDSQWFRSHIASCTRCQKRFISYGKFNLAITAIKSQPHKLDLLMCANSQTIGVLKHSLRKAHEVKKLKTIRPEPSRLSKYNRYSSSVLNLAACITILLLTKIGVFSSMDTFQTRGKKVIQKYYANRIGDDLADEIFPEDINVTDLG